jgi:hypothetical protein
MRVEKAHILLAYAAHATTHVASLGACGEIYLHLGAGLCVMPELGTARNQIRKLERCEETERSEERRTFRAPTRHSTDLLQQVDLEPATRRTARSSSS